MVGYSIRNLVRQVLKLTQGVATKKSAQPAQEQPSKGDDLGPSLFDR